jgi:hypothetical protein
MQVLNIFSWLPTKEISLEKLEQIFVEYQMKSREIPLHGAFQRKQIG